VSLLLLLHGGCPAANVIIILILVETNIWRHGLQECMPANPSGTWAFGSTAFNP
jgi:hypothetical protein